MGSPITYDWSELSTDRDMREFVANLAKLRRDHPVFRRSQYALSNPVRRSGDMPDLALLSPSGEAISNGQWKEEHDGPIGMFLNGRKIHDINATGWRISDDSFILYFNPVHEEQEVRLPDYTHARSWNVIIDTADEEAIGKSTTNYGSGSTLRMASNSVFVLEGLP
jgi:isoamylase